MIDLTHERRLLAEEHLAAESKADERCWSCDEGSISSD